MSNGKKGPGGGGPGGPGGGQVIVLSDERSNPNAAEVAQLATTLQTQVSRDFAPIWGVNATIVTQQRSPQGWIVHLLDSTCDISGCGCFGCHSVNSDSGIPEGFVTAVGDGWFITASHEVLEMLGDPFLNQCASGFQRDVCDPVESNYYNVRFDDPSSPVVSDFAFPSWFGLNQGPQDQWDFLSCTNGPFVLCAGGYIPAASSTAFGS